MSKNGGKIVFAGLLGALAGAIGGLLFAPKSGKKTREDILSLANRIAGEMTTGVKETEKRVKDVFGKVSQEAVEKYEMVRESVADKVAAIKSAGEEIDKEKYARVVEEVVREYKDEWRETKNNYVKLISFLKTDWERVKKAAVSEPVGSSVEKAKKEKVSKNKTTKKKLV